MSADRFVAQSCMHILQASDVADPFVNPLSALCQPLVSPLSAPCQPLVSPLSGCGHDNKQILGQSGHATARWKALDESDSMGPQFAAVIGSCIRVACTLCQPLSTLCQPFVPVEVLASRHMGPY